MELKLFKGEDGQAGILITLGVAAVAALYMVAENRKTDTIVYDGKMGEVYSSLRQVNQNAFTLTAGLTNYDRIPSYTTYNGARQSISTSVPALYPDPYLPVDQAKLKLIRPSLNNNGFWVYNDNLSTLQISTRGYPGTLNSKSVPTTISFGDTDYDSASLQIKSIEVDVASTVQFQRLAGQKNVTRNSKAKASLTIPPPPRPTCMIDALQFTPFVNADGGANVQCARLIPRPPAPDGTPQPPIRIVEGCGGNGLSWDLTIAEDTPVTLAVRSTGVVRLAQTVNPNPPGFATVVNLNGQSGFTQGLQPQSSAVPYRNAASVRNSGGILAQSTFTPSNSGGIQVQVQGIDPAMGGPYECGVTIHVGSQTPEQNNADDSFYQETKIVLADGSEKVISEINKNDKIFNPATGKAAIVKEVISQEIDEDLVSIEFEKGYLIVTKDHNFITVDGAKIARDLKPGDALFNSDLSLNHVVSIGPFTPKKGDRVYDLLLDDNESFESSAYLTEGMIAPNFLIQQYMHFWDYDKKIVDNVWKTLNFAKSHPTKEYNLVWLNVGEIESPIKIFRNPFNR